MSRAPLHASARLRVRAGQQGPRPARPRETAAACRANCILCEWQPRYAGLFNIAELPMSRLTVLLARFIGLFTVLLVVGLLGRGSATVETAVADGSVMLVYAIISLAVGLAMILGHNVWSGGALPVVVTLVGWLILAKGLMLLSITPDALKELFGHMHYGQHYYLYLLPAFLIGLYLTWAGFTVASPNTRF